MSNVALVLEAGLRPNQCSASKFVASPKLHHLTLANYQQRIETLRMYGISASKIWLTTFQASVSTMWLPRLTFVAACAYAPSQLAQSSIVLENM